MKKIIHILPDLPKTDNINTFLKYINTDQLIQSFIILTDKKEPIIYNYLKKKNIEVFKVYYKNKKNILIAILKVYFILRKVRPNMIQCDLVEPSLIGLIAGFFARIKKRMYVRNHSTVHHKYFKHGVIYDKICNIFATHIVAISENVKDVLIEYEKVPESKIHIIYNAVDIENFKNVDKNRINKIKEKYKIKNTKFPIIGVVSRFIEWKGIQYIIPAFKKLLNDYPNAFLILANAYGPDSNMIEKSLKQLPKDSYLTIKFENDIAALYKIFDIFVHVPVDKEIEAFGFVYIEALASGIPSIFTLSGIANEIIKDKENALVVEYENIDSIYKGIISILKDNKLRNKLIQNGIKTSENFSIIKRIKKIEKLYLS